MHNGKKFKNSKEETILGVIIGKELTFDSRINRMYKKAGQKLFSYPWISAFFVWIKSKSYSKAWLNRNFVTVL